MNHATFDMSSYSVDNVFSKPAHTLVQSMVLLVDSNRHSFHGNITVLQVSNICDFITFLHPVVHNSWSVIWIFSHALLSSHNENSETSSGLNVLYACLLADYNLWLPLPYPDTQLEHCLWHVFTPCYQVMMFYLTNFSSLLSPNRGQKSLFYSDKQAFNLSGYMIAHPDDIPCLMLAHQQRK